MNINGNNALKAGSQMDKKQNPPPHKNGKYIITEDFSQCLPKEEGRVLLEEVKQILLSELRVPQKYITSITHH